MEKHKQEYDAMVEAARKKGMQGAVLSSLGLIVYVWEC